MGKRRGEWEAGAGVGVEGWMEDEGGDRNKDRRTDGWQDRRAEGQTGRMAE
jgi:hypothetical protein